MSYTKLISKLGFFLLAVYALAWPFSFMAAIGMSKTFLGIALTSLYLAPAAFLIFLGLDISANMHFLPIMWLPPLFSLGYFVYNEFKHRAP